MATPEKLYIGQEKDIAMLLDEDIIDATMTVTNEDGSNYSFTGWTDIFLYIWDHRGGTLLETLVKTTNLTIATNVITINVDYSTEMTNVTKAGIYYFKVTYLDANSKPITVRFGNLKMV